MTASVCVGAKRPPLSPASAFAFLPVAILYFKGPEQTLFNILKYHALYRRVDWPGATFHDLHVFTSWLDSTQGLTLALLVLAGIVFLRQRVWERAQRAEFYLAAWISLAEGAYLCTPHPTFGRYFIFLVPFMTIVAMAGLYSLGSKMGYEQRPAWPTGVAAVCAALMFSSFGVQIFDATTWQEYEDVARKVAEVTPKGGRIFADELVYFAMQIDPPSGMECSYTHVLNLPPAEEKLFHLITEAEIKTQLPPAQIRHCAVMLRCRDGSHWLACLLHPSRRYRRLHRLLGRKIPNDIILGHSNEDNYSLWLIHGFTGA